MKVLRSDAEYKEWFYNVYPCDLFDASDVELFLLEEKPSEYPCVIYELPKENHENIARTMFISLGEIEEWCHFLRLPK